MLGARLDAHFARQRQAPGRTDPACRHARAATAKGTQHFGAGQTRELVQLEISRPGRAERRTTRPDAGQTRGQRGQTPKTDRLRCSQGAIEPRHANAAHVRVGQRQSDPAPVRAG